MARLFKSKEASLLIKKHRDLIDDINAAESELSKLGDKVSSAAQGIITEKTTVLLDKIPVDELNRDKRGIRIKTLRDNGFQTLGSVYAASAAQLAAVNGISNEGAFLIKEIVDSIAAQAAPDIKIKLNLDDKTPASTELVKAILKYKKGIDCEPECLNLTDFIRSSKLSLALNDLKIGCGFFSWLFASKLEKLRAEDSYKFLDHVINSEYGTHAQLFLSEMQALNSISASEAWDDYAANPIEYFNIIESFTPQFLGAEDSGDALPDEIAQELNSQTVSLDGLKCTLRAYQLRGVKYILSRKRVLLGDEMGLGKTIEAIAAMQALKNDGRSHFMVVCPAGVISNWCREIAKHSSLVPFKLHGQNKLQIFDNWLETGGVAVTSYESCSNFSLSAEFTMGMLVVDEAHYIKNPEARRTQNVVSLSFNAEYLLFMTGTALENKVDEMISLISVLQPELADGLKGMEALSSAPVFRRKISPVYFRRKRADVLTELPELIESREWCSMYPQEELLYENAILNGQFTEARRVSWNVDDPHFSSKAQRLLEIIEDAEDDGRKVIVFSYFLDTVRRVSMLLGHRCVGSITGSLSPEQRQEAVDTFDAAPVGSVLTAQIQAGGTGLNIQSASIVIICEPQFKPSIENQAISRAYRMGQTRNVLVYRLLCENSIDEQMIQLLDNKQLVFNEFADKSVAAEEGPELDDESFGILMKEELSRIKSKREA